MARIAINQYPVDFTAVNLDYLLKVIFDYKIFENYYGLKVWMTSNLL